MTSPQHVWPAGRHRPSGKRGLGPQQTGSAASHNPPPLSSGQQTSPGRRQRPSHFVHFFFFLRRPEVTAFVASVEIAAIPLALATRNADRRVVIAFSRLVSPSNLSPSTRTSFSNTGKSALAPDALRPITASYRPTTADQAKTHELRSSDDLLTSASSAARRRGQEGSGCSRPAMRQACRSLAKKSRERGLGDRLPVESSMRSRATVRRPAQTAQGPHAFGYAWTNRVAR